MSIAFIGPSGAGKGTHANRIAAKYNLIHLSTGDLFRKSLANQTALGLVAKKYIESGKLVPDEVVDALIEEWLRKVEPDQDFLFDNFPTTIHQAQFLDEIFSQIGRNLEAVIYFRIADEAAFHRLPDRIICRDCQTPFHPTYRPFKTCFHKRCEGEYLYHRPDDKIDIIKVRLKVFRRAIGPVLTHYQKAGKLLFINGEGEIENVYQNTIKLIDSVRREESHGATIMEVEQVQALKSKAMPALPKDGTFPTLDLLLLAPPGSGKGTQAARLNAELGLTHIATGDLFRENLKNETPLGKLAKTYMEQGDLVPDDVTEAMVQERLGRPDIKRGFVLDGFPRSSSQAEALTNMMTQMNKRLDGVIYINVSDEEITSRLSGRLVCRGCQRPYHIKYNPPATEGVCNHCGGELYRRADDNPETIKARLKTYHRQTKPLVAYYKQAGILIEIDGEGKVETITDRILSAIQNIMVNGVKVVA